MINELFSKGYISFNLKDLNIDLYNILDGCIPDEDGLLSFIDTYRLSKHMDDTTTSEFVELYKKKYSDWDSTFEGKGYTENLIEYAQHTHHLGGLFYGDYNRLMEIKNWIASEISGRLTDGWAQCAPFNDKIPQIKPIFKSIVNHFYESTEYKIDETRFVINLTCYTPNDFLQPHTDSDAPDKMCVVLIYANRNWNPSFGGQLSVLGETIEPEFGKVVILENTKNDPEHEVLKVVQGNRFALSTFLYYK